MDLCVWFCLVFPPALFFGRFPQGESGLDVYNRATSFIATMFRDFANDSIARDDLNVIIITHGLTLRLVRNCFPQDMKREDVFRA